MRINYSVTLIQFGQTMWNMCGLHITVYLCPYKMQTYQIRNVVNRNSQKRFSGCYIFETARDIWKSPLTSLGKPGFIGY